MVALYIITGISVTAILNPLGFLTQKLLLTLLPQAFRVSSNTSSTARSSVSVVTVVLIVVDSNDNPPVLLNPAAQPIPIVEVGVLIMTVAVYVNEFLTFLDCTSWDCCVLSDHIRCRRRLEWKSKFCHSISREFTRNCIVISGPEEAN